MKYNPAVQTHQTLEDLFVGGDRNRILNDLVSQANPFYAFFTTSNLTPFTVETATNMIQALADVRGVSGLSEFVATDTGQSRLKAIEHLAGGQPRMWATLGHNLTPGGLDELVDTLLNQLDEVTPNYQEQLARLSPLHRRVVGQFARNDHPLTVDAIATELETGSQTISKQINLLHKEKRWLQPSDSKLNSLLDGRRTYYELAEPLSRIIFQLKESRGEPVRLVVDFVKLWFDAAQLSDNDQGFSRIAERWAGAKSNSDGAEANLEDCARVLGDQHPDTIRGRAELADLVEGSG